MFWGYKNISMESRLQNANVCFFLDKNRLRIIGIDPKKFKKGGICMSWHTLLNTNQRGSELNWTLKVHKILIIKGC